MGLGKKKTGEWKWLISLVSNAPLHLFLTSTVALGKASPFSSIKWRPKCLLIFVWLPNEKTNTNSPPLHTHTAIVNEVFFLERTVTSLIFCINQDWDTPSHGQTGEPHGTAGLRVQPVPHLFHAEMTNNQTEKRMCQEWDKFTSPGSLPAFTVDSEPRVSPHMSLVKE